MISGQLVMMRELLFATYCFELCFVGLLSGVVFLHTVILSVYQNGLYFVDYADLS